MANSRRKKRGLEGFLQLVAKQLRDDRENEVVRDPLPQRWVELIHHLDAQERQEPPRGPK